MPHGTHEHLEEVEHAQHAAHDVFNRNVATTMAIIAAFLAAVSLLSHRGHTETLRLTTLSNIRHTQASDIWNFYQAKNIRSHEYGVFLELSGFVAADPAATEAKAASEKAWRDRVVKYEVELPQLEAQARQFEKEASDFQERSVHVHHRVDRFDLGELGIELGLVLASIAILTRRKLFWLAGITAAIIGTAVAVSAFFMH